MVSHKCARRNGTARKKSSAPVIKDRQGHVQLDRQNGQTGPSRHFSPENAHADSTVVLRPPKLMNAPLFCVIGVDARRSIQGRQSVTTAYPEERDPVESLGWTAAGSARVEDKSRRFRPHRNPEFTAIFVKDRVWAVGRANGPRRGRRVLTLDRKQYPR